jgi:hypothetical protein
LKKQIADLFRQLGEIILEVKGAVGQSESRDEANNRAIKEIADTLSRLDRWVQATVARRGDAIGGKLTNNHGTAATFGPSKISARIEASGETEK